MAYKEKEKTNIINQICIDMMRGEKVLSAVKKTGITKDTLFRWLQKNEEFSNQYARAMEVRADLMAEEILEICDSTENDVIKDNDGKEVTNYNVIQRDRLRVDTRKWLMSKMMPKKYSDKFAVDHTTKGETMNKPLINIDPLNINKDDE